MPQNNFIRIIRLALPIILANAAVPLLGLADTAVIGQTGTATDLGAIALAALIFGFVYWGFGFLRMGTTGFIAQALGANNINELHALVFRTFFLGLAIGIVLIALQQPIALVSTHFLKASPEVNARVLDYFYLRIWGAPATLTTFSLLGVLIGMGWTRELLWTQLALNGINIIFNLLFVLYFGLGVKGIALGTVISEWIALFFALYLVLKKMELTNPWQRMHQLKQLLWDKSRLIALVQVNRDIMIRTLALITGFAWFTRQGAQFGDPVLAANHILLQFISLSAFFLDGYANVAEMLVGQAYGANNNKQLRQEIKDSTILAAGTALLLSLLIALLGTSLIPLLTKDPTVQSIASEYKNFAAAYIFVSFAAFQLDGIFIGATQSKPMRNSTVLALVVLITLGTWWAPIYENSGLWAALIVYVIVRAVVLALYYPTIMQSLTVKKCFSP